jgi:hypothetical protein
MVPLRHSGTTADRIKYDDAELSKSVPTLFLGLGGTGKEVLLRFRKRMFEAYQKSTLEHGRFLLLDTDMQSMIPDSESPEDYKDVVLRSEDGETLNCVIDPAEYKTVFDQMNYKRDRRFLSWVAPKMNSLPPTMFTNGAGTYRQAGRLAFFLKYRAIRQQITAHLRQLLDYATNHQDTVFHDRVETVIVTSLAGGTGSGMFIDVAYLVRDILSKETIFKQHVKQPYTTLVAVLPTLFEKKDANLHRRFQQNAYAALQEMELYNTPRPEDNIFEMDRERDDATAVEFVATWEATHSEPKRIRETAWDTCYLIDDVNNRRAMNIADANDVYQMIADYLFLDFGNNPFAIAKRSARSNHRQLRDRILHECIYDHLPTDSDGDMTTLENVLFENRYGCTFSSFGLAEILIDREKINRVASYRLAEQLVATQWLGETQRFSESQYVNWTKHDLHSGEAPPGESRGISLHPEDLWQALVRDENHDWLAEIDAAFEKVAQCDPELGGPALRAALRTWLALLSDPRSPFHMTVDRRVSELIGDAARLGDLQKLAKKLATKRINEVGVEATIELLEHYRKAFGSSAGWARKQAQSPQPSESELLARLSDAERVPTFPFNCRRTAIVHEFESACARTRSAVRAACRATACRALERVYVELNNYVGASTETSSHPLFKSLYHDYSRQRQYLQRFRDKLTERFALTRKTSRSPFKMALLPEWSDANYDVEINKALLRRNIAHGERNKFDWGRAETAVLNALPKDLQGSQIVRSQCLDDWIKSDNDEGVKKSAEALADACLKVLGNGISLEEFKNGNVVDYLIDMDSSRRSECLAQLIDSSAPYLPSIGSQQIDQAFPPAYVNLLGWLPGEAVASSGRADALWKELNGISTHGSDNRNRDQILKPKATDRTTVALVREMTGVPLHYYARLDELKESYLDPALSDFRKTCHLIWRDRDLPDIDQIRPEDFESIRENILYVLRALILRYIRFEGEEFVVEVPDDTTGFQSQKWLLGTRVTRIIKHSCEDKRVRRFLKECCKQWRDKIATPAHLAALYSAVQQTLELFPVDRRPGHAIEFPPLHNCFRKMLEEIRQELEEAGPEGQNWIGLLLRRTDETAPDYDEWKERFDEVSRYIRETCLQQAGENLPVFQIDQRRVANVRFPAPSLPDGAEHWEAKP